MNQLLYLCIALILLYCSSNFFKYAKNDKIEINTSLQYLINQYRSNLREKIFILKNIMTYKEKENLRYVLKNIEDIISNKDYFNKPCITINNYDKYEIEENYNITKEIVMPLRNFNTSNKYINLLLYDMADNYEALINLSRNSFCKKI